MIKKIKYIILFSILLILGLCTQSQARIYTSDPTVKSGGTATITVSSGDKVASGSIDVTSSNGLSFSSASSSNGVANGTLVAFAGMKNISGTLATYKFKVPNVTKTTKYTVTFSSDDMKDENGNEVKSSSATATVTVTANSSSGSGSSSGSNSSSSNNSSKGNSSSTTATKPTFTSVNEKVYATDSVNVRSSYSTSSSVIGSLSAGDEVTRTGKATKSVNGITWSKIQYNGQTAYVSSSYLTTEKPEESNDKELKTLEITGDYELTPAFSKDVTEYSLTVGADVDSLEIKAEASDDNAKVEITGNDNLLMGENTVEIKVTAEDGTVRTYKINVTKGEAETANTLSLSELTVAGYTLSPEFSSNVYQYVLNIENPTITSLNVNAKSNVDSAVIEIAGNNELKLGENIITILVKSEDGTEVTTYQITVNITEKQEEQIIAGIDNNDLFLYGGIAAGALIILIIIIIIAVRRRKRNDDDLDPYYGGFSIDSDKDEENKNETVFNNKLNDSTNKKDNEAKFEDRAKIDMTSFDDMPEIKSDKKSVIEENFGANISNDIDNEKPSKKRGKHF